MQGGAKNTDFGLAALLVCALNTKTLHYLNKKSAIPMQNKYSDDIKCYCLVKEIGRGKTAVVYTAVHQPTKELVTVKRIDTAKLSSLEIEALEEESREVNSLKSKIILPAIVTFRSENALCTVKELMDLGSITSCLQECREFFSEENIRVVLHKVLVGLKALHNEGKVHRNLNSGNILLDTSGKIKFTNPATHPELLDEIREINPEKFHDLSSIFIAPEVSDNSSSITKAVDVWSVGIIAIEMVYGDFRKLSRESVLEIDGLINFRKFTDKESKFREIYGWIPVDLLEFLKRCLVTSAEGRISVAECLNLPFFRAVNTEKYNQFMRESTEIQKIRRGILDLSKIRTTDDVSLHSPRISEAEKIIDEKYSSDCRDATTPSASGLEPSITRTSAGRFVLAEINTNEVPRPPSCEPKKERADALITRRFTSHISKAEYSPAAEYGDVRKYKNEYRKGRFRVVEGEVSDMVPSREALIAEVDYLSRLKNLHTRQIELLEKILECNSVTDRGIEYQLYKEFHELRVLLDQIRLSGAPTLSEHYRSLN